MEDWEEGDQFSFEDSDRFEEDSLCSWSSEPESLCNNWRGWKRPIVGAGALFGTSKRVPDDGGPCPISLCELAARTVASHIPFELVEHVYPPVPEQLQLRIAFWSFPDNEEDIRLYSCLANGSAEEFLRGDHLFKIKAVQDPLQIGFHLSASVTHSSGVNALCGKFNVAVTFDRRRITSCNCTCSSTAYWCSHVVAVCLHRIHLPNQVCLRAPVSESLSRLHREQLQKFAQYLISELPQQILPTAQRLLDELLSSQPSAINSVCGAPDPTAGASVNDLTSWYLDERTLHDNIKKILIKFCVPAPIVFSDVNYLSTTAPPAAAEWSSLLRPLRGREPEGMWNLLSIVREMFKRNDRNAIPLLEIITEECMACEQILVWWFNTKVALHNGTSGHGGGKHGSVNSNSHASQHACSSLCDEIVVLWKLAALNPGLGPEERVMLRTQFRDWHTGIITKVTKSRGVNSAGVQYTNSNNSHHHHHHHHHFHVHNNNSGQNNVAKNGHRTDIEVFPGFRPALEASFLDWEDYTIPGVTYQGGISRLYHCPFTCFRHAGDASRSDNIVNQVNSSQAVLNCQHPPHSSHHYPHNFHHHHNPHLHHSSHSNHSNHSNHSGHSNGCHSSLTKPRLHPSGYINGSLDYTLPPYNAKRRANTINNILCQMNSRGFGHGESSRSKRPTDGNRSSVSSEGFCENETDGDLLPDMAMMVMRGVQVESDSQEGGGSDSSASSSSNSASGSICNKSSSSSSSSSTTSSGRQHNYVDHAKSGARPKTQPVAGPSGISSKHSAWDDPTQSIGCFGVDEVENAFIQASRENSDRKREKKRDSDSTVFSFDDDMGCFEEGTQIPAPGIQKKSSESLPASRDGAGNLPCTDVLQISNGSSGASAGASVGAGAGAVSGSSSSSSSTSGAVDSSSSGGANSERATASASGIAGVTACSSSTSNTNTAVGGSVNPADEANGTRRPSKDDSLSSSTSESPHNSGDEYTVYYYDPKATLSPVNANKNAGSSEKKGEKTSSSASDAIFDSLKKMSDPWEILFARAEGLHAHGHGREACMLGVQLAEEMLANPPELMIEVPPMISKGKRKKHVNPASHQISCLATATLAKCAFLCTVLAENRDYFHLAFRVGMFGLEMARPPASTKPLEVKLTNQESELVSLLKRIPLGPAELCIIRERAQHLKDGTLKSRGEALLPIMLASFIFDALVMTGPSGREHRCQLLSPSLRKPSDEILGFEAAVAAMGLKANVSEADHPLLCEGTRRQRGDLAIVLLSHYKDDPEKMARIMEKLLDRDVHVLIKSQLLPCYYSSHPPIRSLSQHHREEARNRDMGPIPSTSGTSMDQGFVDNANIGCPGSRPHSSTSAELEQGLSGMSLGSPQTPNPMPSTVTSTRTKDSSRYKTKRQYPSIPNQPSESGAHFMFELAKTVLTKAGGNSSTSLFTQPTSSTSHHGPHRALHMCAFQIGLYALGLHNCVSPNWLSRTYSSHVSWITGQAMEIGAPAISFLIDTWEGHLTPPESASIADRASRGCDPHMVSAAAELALSCLPHSHALNPNEIQRAILQCKEQSDMMLEHSCLTVETAAKGGGVYPEVLFQVAKYWYELYMKHSPGCDITLENETVHEPVFAMDSTQPLVLIDTVSSGTSAGTANGIGLPSSSCTQSVVVTTAPPQNMQPLMSVPYSMAPYSFTVQNIHPHAYNQRTVTMPPPQHVQMYLAPPSFQYPPHSANHQPTYSTLPSQRTVQYFGTAVTLAPAQTMSVRQGNAPAQMHQHHQMYDMRGTQGASQQAQQPVPVQVQVQVASSPQQQQIPQPQQMQQVQVQQMQPMQQLQQIQPMQPVQQLQPLQVQQMQQIQPVPQQISMQQLQSMQPIQVQQVQSVQQVQQGPGSVQQAQHRQHTQTQLRYLLAAYRVGMLALETLARRVHDDRPQAKYARNPPYGEDVKWLLRVSKKLGNHYLHQFCVCAVSSIVSPFVLHDVALEAAQYLSRHNPNLLMQHLRSALTPLVQKCQQMYIQCLHQKLYHLTAAEYEDFISIVCSARAAFQITPEGTQQFKEWLQSIKRSKSCKKDLIAQINAALQSNNK